MTDDRRDRDDDRPERPTRRSLLRRGAAVAAAAVGASAVASARPSAARATTPDQPDDGADPRDDGADEVETKPRRRWGMVIDLDRCTACGSCTVACRQENNIPSKPPDLAHNGTHIEWMSMLRQDPEQPGGLPQALPFPCQHCTDAPCVKVCPVGATFKTPEGITMQIWERCIGCRYCMVACPYGRRSFNWDEPSWDGTLTQLLNPDVATRPHGVVEKCTFCFHRLRRVTMAAALEDRPVRDEDCQHLTACAAACPAHAITFGDLHDPDSKVAQLARDPRRFQLLDHLGTEPGVIYLKRDRR